ncbi:MAG: hypothetical protein IJ324_06195 [Lachnospiraceae bacterium]|nr:hypothetical protein [Lachnospiraceae bacterium]
MLQRIKKNKSIQYVLFGIVLYLNLLALCHVDKAKGLGDNAGETIAPIFYAIGTGILLVRYLKVQDIRRKVCAIIGGVLLAFSQVYGVYLHYVNNLFIDAGQVIFLLFVVAGVSITTVPLFSLLFEGIEKARDWYAAATAPNPAVPRLLFVKYWVGIFVCYIPVFLAYWPVNFVYDAKYQLSEVVNNAYKIHHPLLHTWLMGATYNLGAELFDSVSVGISFYTIIQMLICSAAFAYSMWYLYQKNIPKVFRVIVFLFYAVFPMNSLFAISATKDVLFAAFFLIFFITLLRVCEEQEKLQVPLMILMVLSGVLMAHFRKNAVYAMIIAIPFLIVATKEKMRKIVVLVTLLAVVLISNVLQNSLIDVLHATNDEGIREALSIPYQQLARVACYRKDGLDPAIYEEMLIYWDEGFEEVYNPYLSDPIKGTVDIAVVESNFVNFVKFWVKTGLKYPGEYLESFLTNTIGYWYMGDVAHAMCTGDGIAVYHSLIGSGEEIEKQNLCPVVSWAYDPLFFYGEYKETPILAWLFRSSTYFWMLMVYVLYTLYKKEYKRLMVPVISILYYLSCFVGPMVALRYVYAVVVTMPIMGYRILKK